MWAKGLFLWGSRVLFVGVLSLFVGILGYLLVQGFGYFDLSLIEETLFASVQGTILLVLLSVVIATPLGMATGIYMESYAKGRFGQFLDWSFEVLASIPSIIVGLFGFSLLLGLHQIFPAFRSSLLLASASLAILILPYIVKATQLGLSETPRELLSLGYALGASTEQVILRIKLPFARGHILKGIFLSIARAAEDTAVIMLTGVVASYGWNESLFAPFEALPFYIYHTTANYESEAALHSIYVAIILLMCISSILMVLVRGGAVRMKGGAWFR
jgi:phosphate transport system permease protein